MKKNLLLLFTLLSLHVFGQEQAKFDPVSWKAPYTLPLEGWGIERFPMPIEFAPAIPYKGVEDIRFTPGWGEAGSNDYWSYAFLWHINGQPQINAASIEKNLNAYYDGLIGRNIDRRNLSAAMVTKTDSRIKQLKKPQGTDKATFSGTIKMLDYMGKKPMVLHCLVHVTTCPGTRNTIVFHQLSPKPYNNAVWVKLNELWNGFNCKSANTP